MWNSENIEFHKYSLEDFSMELNVLFRDMVGLEKENYDNKNRRFCKHYDEKLSMDILVKDHQDESLIVYCYKNNILVSFIRFNIIGRKLLIMSLQLKKGYKNYFFKLVRDTYNKLQMIDFDWVEGKAYKDNLLALSLHIKLGLYHSRDLGDRLEFITTKTKFMDSLKKYVKT